MWHPTGLCTLNGALLPPWLEVLDFADCSWILDPLDDLCHCDEIHVIVIGQDLIDPVQEGIEEFGIVLQPGSMEVQTQWSTILIVMPIEIMIQEVVELIAGQDVGARVDHSTAGQVLVVGGILATIQFVHDHLPDGVRASWTALQIAVASVWHTEVHGVWP